MAAWRDIKTKARADVHRAFEVPAVYLTHVAGTPVACNVREHTKIAANDGDFAWPDSAGFLVPEPHLMFSTAEVARPSNNSFVIFSADEIYRIGVVEPPREGFVKAAVTALDAADRLALVSQLNTTGSLWVGILT